MNFVWLDINASWSHSSLALPALHANLSAQTQHECNMQVVRGTIKSPLIQIVRELAQLQPTYIFATAWLFNINYLNEVLSRISALCAPEGIFLGGPEFLGDNRDFLQAHPHVSAVFRGEGEEVFERFILSLLERNGQWKSLPGFEWIEDGEYHCSRTVTVSGFPEVEYPEKSPLFSWDKSFVQIETSRGCFNSCRFCVSGIEKAPIQDIPVGRLRSRLREIVSRGIRQVRVLDRTFNGNPARALELLELFKEFAGVLCFHLEVHPALLFPAVETGMTAVGKLRRALEEIPVGLLHIEAGIQTLRQEVLDTCARKGSCAQAVKGLEFLIGTGKFEVHADLIAGLPGYKYRDLVEDTMRMMRIGPAEIQLESLKLLPGTHFRKNAAEYGIRYSPVPPYEVLGTPEITYNELGKAMALSRIIDMWYNDSKWRETFRKIFATEDSLATRETSAAIETSPDSPGTAIEAPGTPPAAPGRIPAAGAAYDAQCSGITLLETLIEELYGTDALTQPLSLESRGILLYRFCMNHAPQHAPLVSLQWVLNGLSMKKEPAGNFIKWDMGQGAENNPLFVEGDPRYRYWYIEIEGTRHWFSFNKEVERVAPCNYKTEKI